MIDFSKLKETSFRLKIGTVVVGAVVIGLMGSVYDSVEGAERPFLSIICIAFILSFGFLLGLVAKRIPDTVMLKRVEISYHFMAALLIFMSGSVFLYSVMTRSCTIVGLCTSLFTRRYLAAFVGFANGALYGLVGWNLLEIKIVSRNVA